MNFKDLPGKKGYKIVFSVNKPIMISKTLNIKWNKIAFLSRNLEYNLRIYKIYALLNELKI